MNSAERVRHRLAGEPVDRPPNFNICMTFAARRIGRPLCEYYQDYRVLVDANLRMAEEFGVDLLQAISDPYRESSDLGSEVEFPPDHLPLLTRPLLEETDQIRSLRMIAPEGGRRMHDRLEAIRRMRERGAGALPVMGWVEGALAEASVLRGVSRLLVDLVDRPEWVAQLLEFCVELEIRFARAQIEAGADIIGLGDAIASQISPRMYRTYALPYEQRIFAAVRAMGARTRLHICGDTSPIVAEMATSGAEIVDLDWMVNWGEANTAVGGKVSLCGNVDPVGVMLQGTPGEVRQAILECLRLGTGRSFSAAGCEIPLDTPAENLHAHAAALRQWGGRVP